MAKINIGEDNPITTENNILPTEEVNIDEFIANTEYVKPDSSTSSRSSINAVNTENTEDIRVYITDQKCPLVILFGPPTCGKTMTLIRLCRYLHKQGYTIDPDRNFRDSDDIDYQNLCDAFPQMINSDNALEGTRIVEFLLIKVSYQGRVICQILEAAGEHYYNPDNPNVDFPPFVHEIMRAPNKRIWTIILEVMDKQQKRLNYVNRIKKLHSSMQTEDGVILLLNKVDQADNLIVRAGVVREAEAIQYVNNLYPQLFNEFKNPTPILQWFKPYVFDFVPFQTGSYSKTGLYTLSHDNYPARLWSMIQKNINGWR